MFTTFASSTTASIEANQQAITALAPAMTHATGAGSQSRSRDPLDDFFGYSASRTHESRHDSDRGQSLAAADVPPPYAAEAAIPLPEYTLRAPEPVTLAMYLFKFGFCEFLDILYSPMFVLICALVFPPFWFFGAFILLSPLREPPADTSDSDSIPAWMPEKTAEEREKIIADIREVELKWARRCLYAFLALVVVVTAASLTAWLVLRH